MQDTRELHCPLQAAAAQSCSSCRSVPCPGVSGSGSLGAGTALAEVRNSFTALDTFPRELLPSHLVPSPEQSTPAPPQANAQTCTRLLPAFFCLGFLFSWFLVVFLFFFPQRRDSRHCSALGDEKQPVVAPYSKLHL